MGHIGGWIERRGESTRAIAPTRVVVPAFCSSIAFEHKKYRLLIISGKERLLFLVQIN